MIRADLAPPNRGTTRRRYQPEKRCVSIDFRDSISYSSSVAALSFSGGRPQTFAEEKMRTYDDDYPTCVETFATLRFYHTDSSPDAVTEALDVPPSKFQVNGMNIFNGMEVRRPISGWFLCSKGEVESKDVRRHVDWIIDQIRGSESRIESLHNQGWRSDINCYWLSIGHGGPMLDPPQMADLAKLNLTCGFDVYSNDNSEQDADRKPDHVSS